MPGAQAPNSHARHMHHYPSLKSLRGSRKTFRRENSRTLNKVSGLVGIIAINKMHPAKPTPRETTQNKFKKHVSLPLPGRRLLTTIMTCGSTGRWLLARTNRVVSVLRQPIHQLRAMPRRQLLFTPLQGIIGLDCGIP